MTKQGVLLGSLVGDPTFLLTYPDVTVLKFFPVAVMWVKGRKEEQESTMPLGLNQEELLVTPSFPLTDTGLISTVQCYRHPYVQQQM